MTFRIGQKVMCVDNSSGVGAPFDPDERPLLDEIYTIRRYFVDEVGMLVVHLEEVRRNALSCFQWGDDVGYGAFRFRPIVDKQTDISVFSEILRKASRTKETAA